LPAVARRAPITKGKKGRPGPALSTGGKVAFAALGFSWGAISYFDPVRGPLFVPFLLGSAAALMGGLGLMHFVTTRALSGIQSVARKLRASLQR
jgi:hypothetical protein